MARSPTTSRSRSPVKRARSASPKEPENACPFLIRIFVTKGRHTPMMEFEEGRFPIQDEFTAYGWNHSTPSSLIQLLLPSFPALYRSPFARYSFRHIYVDASSRGLYRTKELASFTGRDLMDSLNASAEPELQTQKEKSGDRHRRNGLADMELDDVSRAKPIGGRRIEEKTLEAYGFITGDLLSVHLHIPEPRAALRRPTGNGVGGPGPGGPGAGPGGTGPGGERGSFGWPGANAGAGGAGVAVIGQADRTGPWNRGVPLPDQSAVRGAPGGLGGAPGEGAGPGGRWGRGGAQAGGAPRGGGGGFGIRGQGRRSRSPDCTAGSRRDTGPEERGGRGGRSRSPEGRGGRAGRT